jgi:hypothetical protein
MGGSLSTRSRVRGAGLIPTRARFLTFAEVVERLRTMAQQISGAQPDAPQPVIAVLDVSSRCATLSSRRANHRPPAGCFLLCHVQMLVEMSHPTNPATQYH